MDTITPALQRPIDNTYDVVPYDSHPFSQTHPSRLYTVGTLFGMRPAPVHRCRVLELGCAAGGNLLPMAEYLPESEFVGIDLSAKQISDGQELVARLGLGNITLRHASIMDVDASYGMFDYIICHGVFSWVPHEVQEKILNICNAQMNPAGIAYISYNTYPGWHMRGMIRDMMRYHSSRFNTPKDRIQQARAMLDFLAREVKQEGPYQALLRQEVETVRTQADHYLYHEHLEEVNQPYYFQQFVDRANKKGLRYLGEARVATMVTGNFGPDVEKTLRMLAADNIQAEQYMDFLRNRMFRETLLCHARNTINWSVSPESVHGLHVSSPAKIMLPEGQTSPDVIGETEHAYRGPGGSVVNTKVPLLKAIMKLLHVTYPASIPFDQLRRQARELIGGDPNDPRLAAEDAHMLAIGLLNCYMTSDTIDLHGIPISFTRTISARPLALPLARLMATRYRSVPNRRHEVVPLDELDVHLVPLCDGQNDRTAIVDKLTEVAKAGQITVSRDKNPLTDPAEIRTALDTILDRRLQKIASMAVLIG